MSIVTVTEAAAGRIRSLLEEEGRLGTHALRMKVVGGGCSGLQYELSFDDAEGDLDTRYESAGVGLLIDEKSALFLVGTSLDYVDSLMESGFKIENPNATNTCGCGQSFAA